MTLRVLQHGGSWSDSTFRLWNFKEAEFPLDVEVNLSSRYRTIVPFPKLEMQHNKKRKRSVLIIFGKS
jgi:hypothetical protein